MGLPSRHVNAPYEGREILEAADLEQDIDSLFTEINALSNVNLSPLAKIDVTKILAGSIGTAKIASKSVAGNRFVDDAVTAAKIANGAADSASMATGAAVNISTNSTLSEVVLGSSYGDILTVGHTTGDAGDIVIIWSSTISQPSVVPISTMQFKLQRDTTNLYISPSALDLSGGEAPSYGRFEREMTFVFHDSGHAASTSYTYRCQGLSVDSSSVLRCSITILEFRR